MWFTCSAVMKLGVAHQTCSKYRVCMMWYTPLLSSKWTAELGGLGLLNANKNANNISHQFLSSWEYTKRTVLVDTGEISNSINLLLACSLIETKSNDLNSLWTKPWPLLSVYWLWHTRDKTDRCSLWWNKTILNGCAGKGGSVLQSPV